jgi:hypothetical protein
MNYFWRNKDRVIRRKFSDTYRVNSTFSPTGLRSQLDVVLNNEMGSVIASPPFRSNLKREQPQLKSGETPVKTFVAVGHIQVGSYQSVRNSLLGIDRTNHQLTFVERRMRENPFQQVDNPKCSFPPDPFTGQDAIETYWVSPAKSTLVFRTRNCKASG